MTQENSSPDDLIFSLLNANRSGLLLKLLQASHTDPPTPVDLAPELQTLKRGNQTICGLVDDAGSRAEKERFWVEMNTIAIAADGIKAEGGIIKAGKM